MLLVIYYQQNIFSTDKTHKFAYTSLLWNPQVNWLEKFAYNIKNGNVHQSVLEYHQIGIDLINHLHKRETWKVGLVELHDCLIKSIDWENLLKKRPDVPVWLQAKSVRYTVSSKLTAHASVLVLSQQNCSMK